MKILLLLLFVCSTVFAQQSVETVGLTGTLVTPTGVPVNGQMTIALNMANVKNICTPPPYQTVPRGTITFAVINGIIINGASAKLLSNDCMSPRSAYYVTVYDTNHNLLFAVNWYLRQQALVSSSRLQDVGQMVRNYFPPPGPQLPPPSGACKAAAWPMNEGSGLTFHDQISPADNMTLSGSGAVTWQSNAGLPGTTPFFNGTGYAVGANFTKTNFDGSLPFSVAFWTKNSSHSSANIQSQLIGSSTFTNPYIGWLIFENGNTTLAPIPNFEAQGSIVFDLISNGFPNGIQVLCAFCIINDGALHYVAVTYDGSKKAAGVHIYRDGLLQTPIVSTDTLTGSSVNPVPVQVGDTTDGLIPFTGALAFAEIFCTELTAAQVAMFASAGPQIN